MYTWVYVSWVDHLKRLFKKDKYRIQELLLWLLISKPSETLVNLFSQGALVTAQHRDQTEDDYSHKKEKAWC